jgi:hypothetical protein
LSWQMSVALPMVSKPISMARQKPHSRRSRLLLLFVPRSPG